MQAYNQKFFRGDIQGLRGVSAVVIMVYHIWLNKVSGGVDVFFFISGFLIATSLLREISSTGEIAIVNFWSRVSGRILPSALVVVICTALLTLALVPPPLWIFGLNDLIASTLQLENWELFRVSENYLNRDDPPSQFQQFWALSIQFQFYFLIPLVFASLLPVIRRTNILVPTLLFFVLAATASLVWSIYFTAASPVQAYFSTFTRLWEFFLGVMLALVYPYIFNNVTGGPISSLLYNGAVVVFVMFGLITPSTAAFPGAVAVVPVMCALIFIAIGAQLDRSTYLYAVLSSAWLQSLGKLSFTIYLWHWPLLVFMQYHFQRTYLSALQGAVVIMAALVLSWITHRFIETPSLDRLRSGSARRSLGICVAALVIVAVAGLALRQSLKWSAHNDELAGVPDLLTEAILPEMVRVRPGLRQFILSNYDRPAAINECLGRRLCVFGDPDADFTVALVGASHAAQWQPVLDHAGHRYGFRVVTVLSAGRNFELIDQIEPDVVVTISTTTSFTAIGSNAVTANERVDPGAIALSRHLEARGTPIIAIRDNPRFKQYQNGCVWQNAADQGLCSLDRAAVFQNEDPAAPFEQEIKGFHSVDLSRLFCLETTCPAVVNGILVYYDRNHFSETFMRHIASAATDEIMRQAPGVIPAAH